MAEQKQQQRQLLPTNARPSVYHLHLIPHLENFKFKGEETIDLEILEKTPHLVLHCREIIISSAILVQGEHSIKTQRITYQDEDQTATLEFESALQPGNAKLNLEFSGDLNDKMAGFYRSKYTSSNGESKFMATTQFEPTDARRAFPCWDEPAIKAKFLVSITIPDHLSALSNMPPTEIELRDKEQKIKTIEFYPTPIMSTYLLAFVVGELEYLEDKTKEGIRFRVYTPPGKKELGRFALDCGVKMLSYYSDYFNIPYPLPKQDMIAIPDFAAGAMENWGLITYREVTLLCDPKNSPVATRARVAYVVAHELAHQWFGNLVTMEWWTDLWLNEGFATFIGNQAVHHFFPEWETWTQFVSDYVFRAQGLDGLRSSHPIEVPIYKSQEIDEIFDAISYSKGASVISMLANYLGEETFRNGLRIYLDRHKYKNTITKDLWHALSEASKLPVADIMQNWTLKIGYPLVTVDKINDHTFKFSQSRFLSTGDPKPEEDETVWWISIGVTSSNDPGKIHYVDLKERSQQIEVPAVKNATWVKFNAGQSGFFRTKLSPELLSPLSLAISSLSLKPVDRLGVISDAFALARSGSIPLIQAVELAESYKNETNYTVWSELTDNLNFLLGLWEDQPSYGALKKFVISLYRGIGDKLGWEVKQGEGDLDKLLRSNVLSVLGSAGYQNVLNEARKRFDEYIKNPSSLSPDLRFVVYRLAMKNPTDQDFENILNIYKTASMHEEKLRALRALGLSTKPEHTSKVLDMVFSGDIRDQDLAYVYVSTTSTSIGRELSWNHFKSHWQLVQAKFGGGLFLFPRILEYTLSGFSTEEKAKEIEEFFSDKDLTGGHRAYSKSLETIRSSAKFLEKNKNDFGQWLKKFE